MLYVRVPNDDGVVAGENGVEVLEGREAKLRSPWSMAAVGCR